MNIYLAHTSSFDYQNELYIPIRSSELSTHHTIVLPHEHSKELFDSLTFFDTCDLVLAEVSYPSTSLGIELGWAHAKGIKIICIYKTGTEPSRGLNAISKDFIVYDSMEDLLCKLKNLI